MSSAHVPKFGNWEEKDVPYTKYFEIARKEKVASFNPNDPEDNPEAFMPGHPIQQQHSRVHQKPTCTATVNKVKEKKQTGETNLSDVPANITIPKSRKATQRTSSEKWCCLFTKSQE